MRATSGAEAEAVLGNEPWREAERTPPGELPSTPPARNAAYWAAFALCTAAALVPLWSVKYLPMMDLPQHAAQVSIWMHLDDPSYGFAGQYELNWFTPYLLGYSLARALATFTGILIALKIVVTAAIVAVPLTTQVLLDRFGGDRFWALLGFPAAFGFAFYTGFLNFLVAVPFGILFVAKVYRYAAQPTIRHGLAIGAFALFLFFAHALVLGLCGLTAAAIVAARARKPRAFALRVLPLAGALALAIAWALWTGSREEQAHLPTEWGLGIYRLIDLPVFLLACLSLEKANWLSLETGATLLMLLAFVATRPRLSRDPARWVPGVLAFALCILGPTHLAGTAMVADRFAIFLVPFGLVAADRKLDARRARVGHVLLVLVVVGWMTVLTGRFRAFDAEAAGLDELISRMEPQRNVLGLIFDPASETVPGVPHLHAAAWYQAEKGGVLGFSFASFYQVLARHAPTASGPITSDALAWRPDTFLWERDGWYDYFIVRAPGDAGFYLFRDATVPVHLEAQSGMWWLYRVDRPR